MKINFIENIKILIILILIFIVESILFLFLGEIDDHDNNYQSPTILS